MRPFVAANRLLPLKPLKPYLSLGLDVAERARMMQDSLRLLADYWAMFEPVIAGTQLVLAKIELTNGKPYRWPSVWPIGSGGPRQGDVVFSGQVRNSSSKLPKSARRMRGFQWVGNRRGHQTMISHLRHSC